MSRIASQGHEAVEIPDRPRLTPARKQRIWERANGVCWLCSQPVPKAGPGVQYDHRNQRAISADDSDDNLWPMHTEPCHRLKTAADACTRAKVYRVKAKHETPRADWPTTQKIRSRGFKPRWAP